jgi:lauroyl/myristoyl acyltransferase
MYTLPPNSNASLDTERAAAEAKRPVQWRAMPPVDMRTRLQTMPALRALVPLPLALRRAEAKGRANWEKPGLREEAIATMRTIVGGTARAGEVEQLARRRLVEQQVESMLFWRPWRTTSIDARSLANLQRTVHSGRRLLLSSCHLGPFVLEISVFTARGHSPIAVSAPWFFEQPSPSDWGRRLARWWQGVVKRKERLVLSSGGFAVMKALLEAGELLLIYFDLPGSRQTSFLGKPVMLASGSAQLAKQTDALVLPLRARRSGSRVFTDVLDPLDPRDFASAEQLHDALAAVHEASILELAETLEDPRRDGAWGPSIDETEWARPA